VSLSLSWSWSLLICIYDSVSVSISGCISASTSSGAGPLVASERKYHRQTRSLVSPPLGWPAGRPHPGWPLARSRASGGRPTRIPPPPLDWRALPALEPPGRLPGSKLGSDAPAARVMDSRCGET